MLKQIFSLVVSALTAVGCIAPVAPGSTKVPRVVMHADSSFTNDERAAIIASAEQWRSQTSGLADIGLVFDGDDEAGDVYLRRWNSTDQEIVDKDCELSEAAGLPHGMCVAAILGWVTPSGGIHNPWGVRPSMNLIPDREVDDVGKLDKSKFMSVVIHEMGHVLGLSHRPEPQAVMYPSQITVKTCLRQPDLAEFCAVNVCEGYDMHPCEGDPDAGK